MIPVAIIGAGMAGIACARVLAQEGVPAVIFDKGRGIGGRIATRRRDGMICDHGAQYVTAKRDSFAAVLDDLARRQIIAPWDTGLGARSWVGVPGMSALTRGLAAGLDVRQAAQVTAVARGAKGWMLTIDGTAHPAAQVVMTVPAPQVPDLLGQDDDGAAQALAAVRMDPCLTLMATIRGVAPFVTQADPAGPLSWIAQDSSKPARSAAGDLTWVAQAGPAFSRAHLEEDLASLPALMLPLLCDQMGVDPVAVIQASGHRWRYARVARPLGQTFWRSDCDTLYLGGDWCLGPRIEDAWTSGTAIGHDIVARQQARVGVTHPAS